jgi:pyruvate dehydrogenase E2 component (dihydrolipoamide acetyltransferase)
MAVSVVMPALELAQETGKLVSWRKKEGDHVAKGEPLLEIETDKVVVEIEAPAEGILAAVTAHEGAVIPVGKIIAWIVLPGENAPVEAPATRPDFEHPRQIRTDVNTVPQPVVVAPAAESDGVIARISPKARRLAREHGIDISHVRGSGTEGEILASDIEALARTHTPQFLGTRVTPEIEASPVETISSAARVMADRTARSWTTVPHFYVVRDVDASGLIAARERLSREIEKVSGPRPSHTDFLIALVARTLLQHPRVNASWIGEGIRLNREVNVAFAIAVKDAVVAAIIRNASSSSIGEIAVSRRDLVERARAGRLQPSDISGATFTISNLGMYHVDAFSAIIVPPQAGILAVGSIANRVVPVEGRPGIRPMMTLTLSCDHRVIDGARAAAFLNDIAQAIHDPANLLE